MIAPSWSSRSRSGILRARNSNIEFAFNSRTRQVWLERGLYANTFIAESSLLMMQQRGNTFVSESQ
jgi:Zn-finger nucleic acid-binding protein